MRDPMYEFSYNIYAFKDGLPALVTVGAVEMTWDGTSDGLDKVRESIINFHLNGLPDWARKSKTKYEVQLVNLIRLMEE